MGVDRRHASKKSPTQKPVDFFECKQQGGAQGKPQSIPDRLSSGTMREKIWGRKNLAKQ